MPDFRYKRPFVPTPAQKEVDASSARFKILNWGRRTGKSVYGVDWCIQQAIKTPGERHAYVAKTFRQAMEISWFEFLDFIPRSLLKKDPNVRNLEIHLINGSVIQLKGSDKENTLRGGRLGSLVMDEAAYQKPHVYQRILRPRLADLRAPALFISSPRRGWFFRLYEMAKKGEDNNYFASHKTIYDNPYIDREEIQSIKNDPSLSDSEWRQEYMAEVMDDSGQVYFDFDPKDVFGPEKFPGHRSWPCIVGIDYGFNDDTGVVWLHASPSGEVICSQEHVKNGWDAAKHVQVIKMKSKGIRLQNGDYVLDRSAFRKEGTSGLSIADIFRREGIFCHRSEKDPNATTDLVKRFLRGNGERPWLHISSRCSSVIAGLQTWEYGEHEPDALAALRYGLAHLVRRGMSSLARTVAAQSPSYEGHFEKTLAQIAAERLQLDKPGGARWDFQSGGPV